MSLACGRRGGNVPVNRSKVVTWRTTAHSAHHTVHTNVKVLSLNPHGPPARLVGLQQKSGLRGKNFIGARDRS